MADREITDTERLNLLLGIIDYTSCYDDLPHSRDECDEMIRDAETPRIPKPDPTCSICGDPQDESRVLCVGNTEVRHNGQSMVMHGPMHWSCLHEKARAWLARFEQP